MPIKKPVVRKSVHPIEKNLDGKEWAGQVQNWDKVGHIIKKIQQYKAYEIISKKILPPHQQEHSRWYEKQGFLQKEGRGTGKDPRSCEPDDFHHLEVIMILKNTFDTRKIFILKNGFP